MHLSWGQQVQQHQQEQGRTAAGWLSRCSEQGFSHQQQSWPWQTPAHAAQPGAQPTGGWAGAGRMPPPLQRQPAGVAHAHHQQHPPTPARALAPANCLNNIVNIGQGCDGEAGLKAHPVPVQAAAPALAAGGPAALNACRCLNNRLRRANTAEELFGALSSGWQSLDCINLAAALHHLAALAEAAASGGPAFCRRNLLGDPRWGWLLDELPKAAATPGFGPQCVANSLAALCKLDALSPPLLLALRTPLLRALCSSAPAQRLSTRGLTQLLWCIGKDLKSLEPLVLAVKGPLLEALWAAAPELDAQGVSTAWWALGELSSACSLGVLQPGRDACNLLPRLAAAAKATAAQMTLQGLSQVLHACTKMHPDMHRDPALLHSLAAAVARRLGAGQERPTAQGVSLVCLSFGRLRYVPPCHYSMEGGQPLNLLNELAMAMACSLPIAKPQEVCNFMMGLGLLRHGPPAPVVRALLAHLSKADGQPGQPAHLGRDGSSSSTLQEDTGDVHAKHVGNAGAGGPGSRRPPCQLALEQYSSQHLADMVCSLGRMLRSGQQYPDSLLPPAEVEAFFDALDTVLCARAYITSRFSPGSRSELALMGHHVGTIMDHLGRLAATWPSAVLTDDTLLALERHVLANPYCGASLASFLQFYVHTGVQPGPQAVEGLCERALNLLHQQGQPQAEQQRQQGFSLGSMTRMLEALAALRINHPRLLCALLPATAAALAAQEQAAVGEGTGSTDDLVSLAAALGNMHAAGLILPTGLLVPDALLPIWHCTMRQLAGVATFSGRNFSLKNATTLQRAASQLNAEQHCFFLPQCVNHLLLVPGSQAHQHQ